MAHPLKNATMLGIISIFLLPAAKAQEPGNVEARVLKSADEGMKDVEKLHGLKFKHPVEKGLYSKEELKRYLQKEIEKELPESKARAQEIALKSIGLIPRDCDLKKTFMQVLMSQIGGFYDPETKKFYLMKRNTGRSMGLVTMAHELTHALDDQYFHLKELQDSAKRNSDRNFAIMSIIEGSATILMTRYSIYGQKTGKISLEEMMKEAEKEKKRAMFLKKVPPYFTANLAPWYTMGMYFLAKGDIKKAAKPCLEALEKAVIDPPGSSEQILHPRKYWNKEERDDPVEVVLPRPGELAGKGWHYIEIDTLGEINCSLLCRPRNYKFRVDLMAASILPRFWTNRYGMGWGGDSFGVLEKGNGEHAVVWVSAWDTEKDAKEFLETYLKYRKELVSAYERKGKVIFMVFCGEKDLCKGILDRLVSKTTFRKSMPWK